MRTLHHVAESARMSRLINVRRNRQGGLRRTEVPDGMRPGSEAAPYLRSMPSDRIHLSYDLQGIRAAAAELWAWSRPQRILSFSGGLGAGKTTFIHALCDSLGVRDAVSSPTFALINEYELPPGNGAARILHMDWYRLRNTDEAISAGMEDALGSDDAVCLVEWPEQAPELLDLDHISIRIISGATDDQRILDAEFIPAR